MTQPHRRRLVPAVMIWLAGLAPAGLFADSADLPDGFAGAYLAARQAAISADFDVAAQSYTEVLVRDPSNPANLENALLAYVAIGRVESALPLAQKLLGLAPENPLAALVVLAGKIKTRQFGAVVADFRAATQVGTLVDTLLLAWAQLGQGYVPEAMLAFDEVITQPQTAAFGLYHKAMALASVGDFEQADALLSDGRATPTRGAILAHVSILSQLERNADAIALLKGRFDPDMDPQLRALRDQLVAGKTLRFDAVRTPVDGMAEVFLSVAEVLATEPADGSALINARIAQYLRPTLTDATLLSAEMLAERERYDLASSTYEQVQADDPAFVRAELGRADALFRDDQRAEALNAMRALTKRFADIPAVHVTLGDMLRRDEQFAAATPVYDTAIALLGEARPGHWRVYYTRGISHERSGRMDLAEVDMRMALKLNPGQPDVLNYLGYAFIDENRNLDEAMDMIQRAVAARPDNGAIVDSLAWALFRLGRYDEAIEPMERAATLEAVDPIVNDHLGDVYWAVGRKREAEFQWHRALSFDPEPDEAKRIRRKLEIGLDAVLREEGAPPLLALPQK